MGKNVAVFVDVANIFYAAKAAGVDIDYVLLRQAATAGRDLVRAYAYTGLDPDNENQRNFHSFLGRHEYRVVSKDIRKYGDGKVKANLDIELVVDMMKTARNLDVAVVVSGDGDFAPAIRAVQEMGVRVEVISFRGNTSSDLMDVADKFTDITQLAKVDKSSTASGRRVPSDDEDLSMTEVPDKLSEGSGRGRGRGRIRSDREPVAAARGSAERAARPPRTRRAEPVIAEERGPVAEPDGQLEIVALPGEKLSKARVVRTVAPVVVDEAESPDVEAVAADAAPNGLEVLEAGADGDAPRRRRRRGGRGRGRGRGQEGGLEAPADAAAEVGEEAAGATVIDEPDFEVDDESIPAPRPVRPAAFGSIWDSQIGVKSPTAGRPATEDEEFEDEPEIPEYLLAERRNRGGAGGRGGQPTSGNRGNRARSGSYAAAIDRERYGRGGAPAGAGGATRYGEQGGRGGMSRDAAPRRDAPVRRDAPRPMQVRPERLESRPGSSEPWSEVPPELEELLKAQLAQKLGRQAEGRPAAPESAVRAAPVEPAAAVVERPAPARGRGRRKVEPVGVTAIAVPEAVSAPAETASAVTPAPARRRRPAPTAARVTEPVDAPAVAPAPVATAAPKRRVARPKTASTGSPTAAESTDGPTAAEAPAEVAPVAAPKRRAPRPTAAATSPAANETVITPPASAPKRRAPRKAAVPTEGI